MSIPFLQVQGPRGPIFEDAPNFDMAFKLFHGKDGIVPLSGRSDGRCNSLKQEPTPQFNPLAAKVATISLSAFGGGGPFSFGPFSDKWKNQKKKSDTPNKQETSSQVIHILTPYAMVYFRGVTERIWGEKGKNR